MFNSGIRGRRSRDVEGITNPQAKFVQTKYPQPYISGYSVSGLDDTALDVAGGQTILVNGTGFATGVSATLGGTQIGAVSLVSPTQISFTAPAKSAGTYSLVVYNSTGGAAILVPGITYSSFPTYTTAAGSIGSLYETQTINTSVVATSDSAITYTLASGTLPTGATLSSSGVITGTAPVDSGSTTYTFSIKATDAELQDVTRTFTLTVNTDVVTWVTPSSGSTINLDGSVYSQALTATDAAGYSVSYTANALPTGLTLSSGTISGTPTVEGTTSTLLTATAATSTRSATSTMTWTVSVGDLYFKNVSLLLGANASSQTSSFVSDAGINNSQLTITGDTRAQSFHPYQPGYYSYQFNGSSDYISIPSNSAFDQNVPFTIECWIYPLAGSAGGYFFAQINNSYMGMRFDPTGRQFVVDKSYIGTQITSTSTYSFNNWYHVALCYDGTTTRLFVNGTLQGSVAGGGSASAAPLWIGSYNSGSQFFAGYISNFRMVKGALYIAAFTPPTTPLLTVNGTTLLTCQSNKFTDVSANNLAVTPNSTPKVSPANPFTTQYVANTPSYSIYAPGTGVVTATIPAIGTNDFTIEFWMYQQSGESYMFNLGSNWGDSTGIQMIYYGTSVNYCLTVGGQNSNYMGGILQNQWVHVAIVRKGSGSGNVVLYYNGVPYSTTFTVTTNLTATSMSLFGPVSGAYWATFTGTISNFRLISGQAIYSGIFNPPTSPLTTTTVGTSGANVAASLTGTVTFLAANTSTFKDISSNNAAFVPSATTIKPVALSPFAPAYYGVSMTNGDYLSPATSSNLAFGANPYTVEFWIFLPSYTNGNNRVIDLGQSANSFGLQINNTNTISITKYSGADVATSNASFVVNQWNHVAVVRSSTSSNGLTFYLNGTSIGTGTDANTWTVITTPRINGLGGYTMGWTGYLSNLRVVTGTAVYSANFTPSTTPLTAISNTSMLICNSMFFVDNSINAASMTTGGSPKVVAAAPFTQPTGYTGTTVPTTYGSAYFDGTGDYITVPTSSGYAPPTSTSAWTIEFWFYATVSGASNQGLYRIGSSSMAPIAIVLNSSNLYIDMSTDGSTWNWSSGAKAIVLKQWNHVALVRNGSTTTSYINGVTSYSAASITLWNPATSLYFGVDAQNLSWTYTGYLSDVRVVNGTALYTSNFVPQLNAPLTNVTNTQLLTLQTNGSHNTSVAQDMSSFNNVITRNGNANLGTFSPYGDNWSVYFNGANTDSLAISNSTNLDLPGDFTIEAWVYTTNTTNQTIVAKWDASPAYCWTIAINPGSSNISLGLGNSGAYVTGITWTFTFNVNTWYHVAVTRSGTTIRGFQNGVVSGTTYTNSSNLSGTATTYLGRDDSVLRNFYGYISNVRVVKGTALYTSSFTPSTNPLSALANTQLLTCQSPRFADNSVNNFSFTVANAPQVQKFSPFNAVTVPKYYSTYFNGSTDYLTVSSNSAFAIGTGDFTIEFWGYWNSVSSTVPGNVAYTAAYGTTGTTNHLCVYITSAQVALAKFNTGGDLTATTTETTGVWSHYSITRSSGTAYIFKNGALITSGAVSTSYTQAGFCIGGVSGNFTNGYISNLRFVNGTALYTSSFTPSVTPLTAVANTKLLTCQSNTVIDSSSNNNTITAGTTTVKPLQASPFTPAISITKYPYSPTTFSGSYYFDGTGDYLQSTVIAPGTLDFTIEGWVYFTSVASGAPNIFSIVASGSSTGFQVYGASSGWGVRSNTVNIISATGTVTANTWYHVALVRKSGTSTLYINGVYLASTSSAYTFSDTQFNSGYTPIGQTMTGYVSDLRYTPGAALYTSNFYPGSTPLTALQTIGTSTYNAALLLGGPTGGVIDQSRTLSLETVGDAKVSQFSPYNGTYYSNYFNGSSDFISYTQAAALSGDFTIECWVNIPSYPSVNYWIWGYRNGADTSPYFFIGSTGLVIFGGDITNMVTSSAISLNQWNHIAVTRSGLGANNMKLFMNGALVSQSSTTQAFTYTGSNGIGKSVTSTAYYFSGYMSNFRIVNGTSLYNSAFTPSTTPLTAVTNTVMLTCQSNKFIDNSSGAVALTANGSLKVATQNPFQVNSGISYYFDGTGDWLAAPATFINGLGTGNLTIEAWVYTTSIDATYRCVFSVGNPVQIYTRSGTIEVYFNDSDDTLTYIVNGITGPANSIVANTWNHIAVVRNGTSFTAYVNGVAGTPATSGSAIANTSSQLQVGAVLSTYPFTGYITDLRVTKGVARYTTTFTPPTSPVKSS